MYVVSLCRISRDTSAVCATMACGELEISLDRKRRRVRSLHWLPVFVLTVIFSNLPTSTAQECPNGTYLVSGPDQTTTSSPVSLITVDTTNTWTTTRESPNCRNCSSDIEHCIRCEFDIVLKCHECTYGTPETNCTKSTPTPSKSTTNTIIIAVVVSVVGVLVLAGIIVGIVFGYRRGVFEGCQCPCKARGDSPPPMPPPDNLGVSFSRKIENEESGTGQRVDPLRYTDEPGGTQSSRRAVESVHYDGYNTSRNDDSLYVNAPNRNIVATVKEEDEEPHTNADDQDDDVYVNTVTPIQASSSKAPRPRTKPKTPAKPTTSAKPNTKSPEPRDRGSIFPPEVQEDVYSNEPEPEAEDDDEDYVNSSDYRPGMR